MRARDGTIVEVSEWKSREAIDAAHRNPNVLAMWEKFFAMCDCVPLNTLAEAQESSSASNQWKTKPAEHRPQARVNIQVLHLQHQNVNFILSRFRFSTESYWRLTQPHYKLSGSENDAISLAAR